MKKLLTALAVFALVFAGCAQPANEENPSSKLPSLTIRNESSFVLTNVTFSGIPFVTSGNDLPVSSQAVKQLTENDLNKTGYITFTRKDIGINLRSEAISIGNQEYTFTFLDTSVVEEVGNASNRKTLAQISFLSAVAVERGGLTVAKGDIESLDESVVNIPRQFEFTLRNNGVGKLLFTGTQPVQITGGGSEVFSVVQPSSSEIAPGAYLTFRITFTPTAIQNYSGLVTISSNDQSGDFTFTITARGTPSKPIANVFYENTEILQNGTINAGQTIITLPKNFTVEIRNTGTEVLNLDTANITITGDHQTAFSRATSPGSSISIGGSTSFNFQFNPTVEGENNAVLTIPTNDSSRNPVVVLLKATGEIGHAIPQLKQNNTTIQNSTLTPQIDFGQVIVGNFIPLTFTIKNIGNILLELTGTPRIESTNSVFSIQTQPTATIAPNAEASFNIRYTPSTEGEDTATITFANNSDDLEFSFMVKGTGHIQKPQITVKQGNTVIDQHGEYNFGAILVGKTNEITFSIENSGDASLTFITVNGNRINLVENDVGLFNVTLQPSTNTTVTPGNTTTFSIKFSPTVIGTNFNTIVQIKTNSRDNDEFFFRIKGDGRSYEIGDEGPGGGIIFFVSGGQYKECSGELGKMNLQNAKTTVQNYNGNGFNNWQLPDIGDLNLMYQNIGGNNNIGGFLTGSDDYYWSLSTEVDYGTTYILLLRLYGGGLLRAFENSLYLVRAVRSFSL